MSLWRRLLSEFLGTAGLLSVVVGSGIMAESLSDGNAALALLANSIATGAGLLVLIQCFGSISGAHFNPVVSLVETFWGKLELRHLPAYWLAQFSGGIAGVLLAHAMFEQALFQISTRSREGFHLALAEAVATCGLISTIALAGRKHVDWAPLSVAAYITAAYWFTASTSFANPAVTVARMLTNTFTGIAPSGAPMFIASQIIGAMAGYGIVRLLAPSGEIK